MKNKSEIYKSQITSLLNEIWNDKNLDIIDNYFTDLTIIDSPISRSIGRNAKKEIVKTWFDGLPDVSYKTDVVVCENNYVISNWKCRGTHLGDLMGISKTFYTIEYEGSSTFKFSEDNKICYYHAITNITDVLKSKNIEFQINQTTNFKDPNKIIDALKYAIDISMTEKEIRILSLWLRSFRVKDIAHILNKSPRTIEGQLSSIKSKMKLNKATEIISYLKSKNAFVMFDIIFDDTIIKYSKPNYNI
jgi:DNA-binding CsgD family transcriptional regulator/predicted ester cyclase